MKAAIRDNDPVFVMENTFYGEVKSRMKNTSSNLASPIF